MVVLVVRFVCVCVVGWVGLGLFLYARAWMDGGMCTCVYVRTEQLTPRIHITCTDGTDLGVPRAAAHVVRDGAQRAFPVGRRLEAADGVADLFTYAFVGGSTVGPACV